MWTIASEKRVLQTVIFVKVGEALGAQFPEEEASDREGCDATSDAKTNDAACAETAAVVLVILGRRRRGG